MDEKPFFSRNLVVVDEDGDAVRPFQWHRVSAFSDCLEIERRQIHYSYLARVDSRERLLTVEYLSSTGSVVVERFRHGGIFSARARKHLGNLVERIRAAQTSFVHPTSEVASDGEKRSFVVGAISRRTCVAVKSQALAFPPQCPSCDAPAETIAILSTSTGVDERARWIVPTCNTHVEVRDAIRFEKWRPTSDEIHLSFSSRDYASDFFRLNAEEQPRDILDRAASSPLALHLASGSRFVFYQWAFSMLTTSMLQLSRTVRLTPDQSAALRSTRYSVLTLLFGWWGLPGPLYVIAALKTNFRGGLDATGSAARAIACAPTLPQLEDSIFMIVLP